MRNKTTIINRYVQEEKIDLLAITETWLKEDDRDEIMSQLGLDCYKLKSLPRPRQTRPAGGVALLYRNTFTCDFPESAKFDFMEVLRVCVSGPSTGPFDLYILYHPPPTSKYSCKKDEFLGKLKQLFDCIKTWSTVPFVLLGDFNDGMTEELRQLLQQSGLTQYVTEATHKGGNILDLVIARSSDQFVTDVSVVQYRIADHNSVECILSPQSGPSGHPPSERQREEDKEKTKKSR